MYFPMPVFQFSVLIYITTNPLFKGFDRHVRKVYSKFSITGLVGNVLEPDKRISNLDKRIFANFVKDFRKCL